MRHTKSIRILAFLLALFVGSFFLLDRVDTVYAKVVVIGGVVVIGLIMFFAPLYGEKKRTGR